MGSPPAPWRAAAERSGGGRGADAIGGDAGGAPRGEPSIRSSGAWTGGGSGLPNSSRRRSGRSASSTARTSPLIASRMYFLPSPLLSRPSTINSSRMARGFPIICAPSRARIARTWRAESRAGASGGRCCGNCWSCGGAGRAGCRAGGGGWVGGGTRRLPRRRRGPRGNGKDPRKPARRRQGPRRPAEAQQYVSPNVLPTLFSPNRPSMKRV